MYTIEHIFTRGGLSQIDGMRYGGAGGKVHPVETFGSIGGDPGDGAVCVTAGGFDNLLITLEEARYREIAGAALGIGGGSHYCSVYRSAIVPVAIGIGLGLTNVYLPFAGGAFVIIV